MSTSQKVIDVLTSRYEGKQHGESIQSRSPYRNGDNPTAFLFTPKGDEFGVWKDFVNGASGSLYQLAEHLGIDVPKRTPVESSLRPYLGLADYAQSKGVSADVFERAKWSETIHATRPCLKFPTAGGFRYRFLDGKSPKFISDKGYIPCLYGLKIAPQLAESSGLPLILCNGEPSVIVAQHFGLPAVCKTSGEAQYPKAILDELLSAWSGSFVIAMDCDATGRTASEKIARQLADLGRGAVIVDLSLGDKGDLADFCKLHTDSTIPQLKSLIELSVVYAKPDETKDKIDALAIALGDVKRAVSANKPQELPAVIESAQATLDALALDTIAPKTMTSIQVLESLGVMIERGFDGIASGFHDLDRLLGGIPNGAVTVLYGATGMGKSTWTASVCANWEAEGRTGCYITTELKPERFMLKVLSVMSNLPSKTLMSNLFTAPQNEARLVAMRRLMKNRSSYIDAITPSMAQLKNQVRKAVDNGASFVIVDSMSKLALANDYTATATAHNVILDLARETNLPFLVTSQINKVTGREDKTPRLDDSYGGRVIEQNAHNVVALYRHEYYVQSHEAEHDPNNYPNGTARLVYLKTRDDGCTGKYSTISYREGVGFFNLASEGDF